MPGSLAAGAPWTCSRRWRSDPHGPQCRGLRWPAAGPMSPCIQSAWDTLPAGDARSLPVSAPTSGPAGARTGDCWIGGRCLCGCCWCGSDPPTRRLGPPAALTVEPAGNPRDASGAVCRAAPVALWAQGPGGDRRGAFGHGRRARAPAGEDAGHPGASRRDDIVANGFADHHRLWGFARPPAAAASPIHGPGRASRTGEAVVPPTAA